MLSVVIPALNAATTLPATLAALGDAAGEVVVVDGGSRDATFSVAAALGARVLAAPRGRGGQLAAGVAAARGAWLLLLHADTRLASGWAAAARAFMAAGPDRAGYFRFALEFADPRARRLERLVAWRCRCFSLPYGDQGLLIARSLLDRVGGIRPLPLMEDVESGAPAGPAPPRPARGGGGDLGGALGTPGLAPPLGAQSFLSRAVFRRCAAANHCQVIRMKGDTVFVFARAPRLGTVKRRLAAGIGARAALRFHAATLARLLRALAADRRFATMLAITPDRARIRPPPRVAVIGQGRGDLGARMARALGRARRAAVVGSDIPELGADDVAAAFRALGRADACFGPAEDGGYWLVALGPRRPQRPFAGVRWSGPHALADTLENFTARRVTLLRRLRDVDTPDDLSVSADRPGRAAQAERAQPWSCTSPSS